MRCKHCGAEIPDKALVCGHCGTPVTPYDSAGRRQYEDGREKEKKEEQTFRDPEENVKRNPYAYDDSTQGRDYERYRRPYGPRAERRTVPEDENKGFATASLVLGIASICAMTFPYIMPVLSIAAIAFGVLGLSSSCRRRAAVGLVMGVLMLIAGIVLIICVSALAPYGEQLFNLFYQAMQ